MEIIVTDKEKLERKTKAIARVNARAKIRYVYMRDSKQNMRVTVAYIPPEGDTVYYGTLVVSPSEPLHDVSKHTAKCRASSRALNAVKIKRLIDWNPYMNGYDIVEDTHGDGSPYRIIKGLEFKKLGNMPTAQFRKAIRTARQRIANIYW